MKSSDSSEKRTTSPAAIQNRSSSSQGPLQQKIDSSQRMIAQRKSFESAVNGPIQAMGDEEELQAKMAQFNTDEEEVQAKMTQFNVDEEEVQAKMSSQPIQKSESKTSNSTGIPDVVKQKMESSMNADFSSVKIHENSGSASDVGALAYAQGNDVHFAPGQFKPETQGGQALIGHELAHVVQQREGKVKPTTEVNGMAVNDDPKLEKEADDKGAKAASF